MNEDQVTVTLPAEGLKNGHTRFQAWGGDHTHARYFQLDARRVVNSASGQDEAQIELSISQTRRYNGARTNTVGGGFVLTPEQARILALAICPELAPK